MVEKLNFHYEFAISQLIKIIKNTKKRNEPRNACDLFDFISELSGDIRQLKDVIEEVKAINKKLLNVNKKMKVTVSEESGATKVAKIKKPKKAETKKLMIIEEAEKLLFKKQQNLKSIKKRRDTLIPESFSVKGPKLNDEMLTEIMQKIIRKNEQKGIDLARFMLAGKEPFETARSYFSKFKFSKAEVSYSYVRNNKLSLTNREQNIQKAAESNSASKKSKESENDESSESDDSDIVVIRRPSTDKEEKDDTDWQRWEFSADSYEWHKNEKGFHPHSIKNNTLEFHGFLLMKPLSLVFAPSIKEITIENEPDKQLYPFLNSFTELDELIIEGYGLREDEDEKKENSRIFVNYLKELKKVEIFKIPAGERIINLKILENITFNVNKFIIQELPFECDFPNKIMEKVNIVSLTIHMEESECKKFTAKKYVSKYLNCFPNAKTSDIAFQFDTHNSNKAYPFTLKKEFAKSFKNLCNSNLELKIRIIIPVLDEQRKIPANERNKKVITKVQENITLSVEYPIMKRIVYGYARKTTGGGPSYVRSYF